MGGKKDKEKEEKEEEEGNWREERQEERKKEEEEQEKLQDAEALPDLRGWLTLLSVGTLTLHVALSFSGGVSH